MRVFDYKEVFWRGIGFRPVGRCVNIASGYDYRNGWLNVDYHNPNSDLDVDLFRFPWPLPDNSFDSLLMDNYLEHVPHILDGANGLFKTIGEVQRILKPGGQALIQVPHGVSRNALSNPAHFRFFVPSTLGFLWGIPWQRPTTQEYQATVGKRPLELVRYRVRRLWGWHRFNNLYHIPKYLGLSMDRWVGWRVEIAWLLKKPNSPI